MTGLCAGACLSLSGRFAPFGRQATDGLRLWAEQSGADLTVLDDESEPAVLAERLPGLAARVDLLFGPYSTVLMRAAVPIAADAGRLLFNHGGSGGVLDLPGQVVNVLTPASRYALPFVALLGGQEPAPLYTATRRGVFGRDVVAGVRAAAQAAGLQVKTLDLDTPPGGGWDLVSAGVYEDDVETVRAARALANPPRLVCSVAAGVAQFAADVEDPDGMYGVGQWAPGAHPAVLAGLPEPQFLDAWRERFGGAPDYPGVQSYAAGVIAEVAVHAAGTSASEPLWRAVAALDLSTVFGRFRIDPATGVQVGHDAALTRWHSGRHDVYP